MRLIKMGFFVISFIIALLSLNSSAHAITIENVIGAGFGLPYGGVGINYELGISDYFAPTAGVGYVTNNAGWAVGARLYYPGRNATFRFRATGLYGTNALLQKNPFEERYDTQEGFSGGFGFNWRYSDSWAFDADIFVVDVNLPTGYQKKGGDIKGSVGFSVRW